MKRTRILLLLAFCVVLAPMPLLAAGADEAAKESGPVKMTFWHLWGGSREQLINDLVKKFKADHPNVELDVTFTPPNDLQTKVVQAAGTGTLPDVFEMHSGWYDNLQPQDTMAKLDPYLAKDKIDIKTILLEPEWKRSIYKGAVYSLPNVLAGGQGLFFYNKGLMKKAGLDPEKDAPKNWDDFVRVSKILVKALNQPGKLDVIVWDPWMHVGQNMIQVYSHVAGSPTVSADSKTSLFNTPGVLETARKFDQYITDVYGPYGGYKAIIEWSSRVAGVDYGAAQVQAFIKEAQVFYVSGSWTIGQVQAGNAKLDMGILPIPGFKGPQGAAAMHGWSYAMNIKTKYPQTAWALEKFLTIDPKGNGEFCIAQGRPCPITAVNDDPRYLAQGEIWKSLVVAMKLDYTPEYNDHFNALIPWLRDVPARRVSGQSIDEAMGYVHKMFSDYLKDLYKK
jgi:ABC-type glycerol-3-phosphate transport system substrate-binding protein